MPDCSHTSDLIHLQASDLRSWLISPWSSRREVYGIRVVKWGCGVGRGLRAVDIPFVPTMLSWHYLFAEPPEKEAEQQPTGIKHLALTSSQRPVERKVRPSILQALPSRT